MAKKMVRKRITGPPTPAQKVRWQTAWEDAEADAEETRGRHRALLAEGQAVSLTDVTKAIRAQRLAAGLAANAVAEKMGVDSGNFARLEVSENPTLETVQRMADAVGVEVLVTVRKK